MYDWYTRVHSTIKTLTAINIVHTCAHTCARVQKMSKSVGTHRVHVCTHACGNSLPLDMGRVEGQ